MITFETGRIRPPSEATSILLRITRGCHWDKCAFCPVYKDETFSVRKVDEIKRDIDAMEAVAERIRHRAGGPFGPGVDAAMQSEVLNGPRASDAVDPECWRLVAFWMFHGLQSVFLQDADALVLRAAHLAEILTHLRAAFPSIRRITSYSRARTASRKSLDDWHALRTAGLSRVHVGMESGADSVLGLMNKGVTQKEQIRAGRQLMNAGIELSEYFMPGLGGRELSREHALESAAVLSAVNPTFLRIRTTVPIPGTPLYRMMEEGRWAPLTEEEKVRELRDCFDRLDGVTTIVHSDHMMNLLEDVAGRLPRDRARILDPIDRFLSMAPADREAFVIGRRIGLYRHVSDFAPSPEVERARRELIRRFGSTERGVMAIVASFV